MFAGHLRKSSYETKPPCVRASVWDASHTSISRLQRPHGNEPVSKNRGATSEMVPTECLQTGQGIPEPYATTSTLKPTAFIVHKFYTGYHLETAARVPLGNGGWARH